MDDLLKIPWGRVLSNFIWILGAAVVLAAFSYHEFLGHAEGVKRREVFKRKSFQKTFLFGLILAGLGVSLSLHAMGWKVFSAAVTAGVIILFYRQY